MNEFLKTDKDSLTLRAAEQLRLVLGGALSYDDADLFIFIIREKCGRKNKDGDYNKVVAEASTKSDVVLFRDVMTYRQYRRMMDGEYIEIVPLED